MASNEIEERSSLEDLTSRLISVTEASQISGLTTSFIRRLLREGRIEGVKIGRNWLTTEEAIQDYMSQERRPGPKPKGK
jgi:excisionase family DNA binding protein